jgi:hypothetical protein
MRVNAAQRRADAREALTRVLCGRIIGFEASAQQHTTEERRSVTAIVGEHLRVYKAALAVLGAPRP